MIRDIARGCPDRLSRSGVGPSSPGTPSASVCMRLLLFVPCLASPMARQNLPDSPRTVSNTRSSPPISSFSDPICLAVGEAKAAASARPRYRLRGRIGWRVAQKWVAVRSGWSPACLAAAVCLAAAAPLAFGPTLAKMVTAIRMPRRGLPVSSHVMKSIPAAFL